MSKWTSRKFWLALIGGAVPVLNVVLDLNMDATQVAAVLIPIIAYIFGEAWVDSNREQSNGQ